MRAFVSTCVSLITIAAAIAQSRADVPFQIIDRGAQSGETSQGVKVLRTERAFEEFLKDKGQDQVSRLSKQVDWNSEQVVVVFGGQQPTGGFGIDVKKIASIDIQRLVIEAELTKPRSGQVVTQALTTPYVMLKMKRQVAAIKVKFGLG